MVTVGAIGAERVRRWDGGTDILVPGTRKGKKRAVHAGNKGCDEHVKTPGQSYYRAAF